MPSSSKRFDWNVEGLKTIEKLFFKVFNEALYFKKFLKDFENQESI